MPGVINMADRNTSQSEDSAGGARYRSTDAVCQIVEEAKITTSDEDTPDASNK